VQRPDEVGRKDGEHYVVADVEDDHQSDQLQDLPPRRADRLVQRGLRDLLGLAELSELRGVVQA
jgi:hypothetical protein